MKCNRYVFSYASSPEEVKDYILRLADLASKTYGRDIYFARFHQMLDNARFLGWDIPRFGGYIPEVFQDLTEEAIDYIFENQAKILVDISPVSEVALEGFDVRYPVRMIGGTTPAGDLVWKCHLLVDEKSGQPYVMEGKKRFVKTKGTRIICSTEMLPYEEEYLEAYFGGPKKSIWPVPFLPEIFSDHSVAKVFTADPSIVETVHIEEKEPVRVLATRRISWYRPLEINPNKAISIKKPKLDSLEVDDGLINYINVLVNLTSDEMGALQKLEESLKKSGIANRREAEVLREDPEKSQMAEQWLLTNWRRKTVLANAGNRIGALFNLLKRHDSEPVIVIHPREKWAQRLCEAMEQRGIQARYFGQEQAEDVDDILDQFVDRDIQVLVMSEPYPDVMIEGAVVIAVSSFNKDSDWLEYLNSSHKVYAIALKQLGIDDCNLLQEHEGVKVLYEAYDGLPLVLMKGLENIADIKPVADVVEAEDAVESVAPSELVESAPEPTPAENVVNEVVAEAAKEVVIAKESETPEKPKKAPKPKKDFKIITGKGRPVKAATMEEARLLATKKESEGHNVQILDGKNQVVYITRVGEVT